MKKMAIQHFRALLAGTGGGPARRAYRRLTTGGANLRGDWGAWSGSEEQDPAARRVLGDWGTWTGDTRARSVAQGWIQWQEESSPARAA